MIQSGLRGMSQDPQVLVSHRAVDHQQRDPCRRSGSSGPAGALDKSGIPLDAIALAGGYRGNAKDAVARVQRDGQAFEIRLSDLLDMPQEDVQVAPGDRITLISRPQSFSVLGAPNKADEMSSLDRGYTGGSGRGAGGANPNAGDAGAIFVFRYVPRPDGTEQATSTTST